MKLTKKQATIKYCVYCLLIVIADLMQNVGGLWFEIGGAFLSSRLPLFSV